MKKLYLKNNILYFITSLFLMLTLFYFINSIIIKPTFKEIYEDFNIYVNDEKMEETNLKTFKLDKKLKRDDVVILEKQLENIKNQSIAIFSRHATIKVYINDELEYEYDRDIGKKYKMVDGRYHLIPLDDYESANIKIIHTVCTTDTIDEFNPIYIDSQQNIKTSIINSTFLNSFLSSILIAAGVILIVINMFIKNKKDKNILLSLGLFIVLASLWSLCESGVLVLIFKESLRYKIVEMFSLFSLVIPFCFYNYNILEDNVKERKWFKLIIITTIIFNIIAFGLNFLDIYPVRNLLPIIHIIICITIALTIKVCLKYKTIQTQYLSLGLIYLVIIAFLNILFFYTEDFLKEFLNLNLIIVGIFVFSTSVLYGYFKQMINLSIKSKEAELLSKIAYIDSLTGTYNRAKYEKDLDLFTDSDVFGTVFYDLNKLKTINDTMGHEKGDELIKNFANILKNNIEIFDANAYRLGGDEFVIIFKNKRKKNIESFINNVKKEIELKNKTSDMEISVSYGMAISNEESNLLNIRDIVKLADERMYIYKSAKR